MKSRPDLVVSVELSNGTIFEICYDDDPMNPREWDNLGTMVCWSRRYKLGDTHDFKDPEEFEKWWKENGGDGVILPLYLYDHGGITMNTTGFSCRWDSGQVGWIYVTAERIRKELCCSRNQTAAGRIGITPAIREAVTLSLVSEVEEYDNYITGNCFGFVLKDKDGNIIDSCWGFLGSIKENGILDGLSEDDKIRVLEAL